MRIAGIAGGFIDFWQRPFTMTPDQMAKGRYLVLAPGQEAPADSGLEVLRMTSNKIFLGFRVLGTDPKEAAAAIGKLMVYPFAKRTMPTAARIVTPDGRPWSGTQPRGITYWERLAEALNGEVSDERDRFFMAMLKPLGIEKGRPFAPDERQKRILTEAALVGEAMAKANTFDKRLGEPYWPGGHWKLALIMDPRQRVGNIEQLDERAAWFYEAVTASEDMATKKVGVGSTYLGAYKDRNGQWLDGGKTYRLHIPPEAPARNFWSATAYDVDTRCFIKNNLKIADRSSRMDLKKNTDGSVDIYFGPKAPAGFEQNWIPTVAGRGWFTYFRLYAPTEAYFDRSWKLPDIEPVTGSN